jgi:hypothetical protein
VEGAANSRCSQAAPDCAARAAPVPPHAPRTGAGRARDAPVGVRVRAEAMAIQHPVERGGDGRGKFDHVAERASNVASSPLFFWICSALVIVWALSYAFDWAQDVRFFLGDLMAAVTLALVALLKNAERRAEHAVQYKLDAIARAMLESRRGTDDGAIDDLGHAIGRHQEV